MKAVIIGATVSAMQAALVLRKSGYDVKIVVSSTYLGEDFTGTWRYYPLSRQEEGKQLAGAILGKPFLSENTPLLNGDMKKRFLEKMDEAQIPVLFMTRAAGVKSENGIITHVTLADKLGAYEEPCDILIDGTLYHELSSFLSGDPVTIKAGLTASLMFNYLGMEQLPEEQKERGVQFVRGAACGDHAFMICEHCFTQDVSLEEARKLLVQKAVQASKDVHNRPAFSKACLMGTFAPMVDVQIAPSPEKSFENLSLPDEILTGAPKRAVHRSKSPFRQKITCDVLVVGAGTAGIRAALAAQKEKASVCLAEFFTTLGGTRTTGGVQPLYDGNRNRLLLEMWKDIRAFAEQTGGIRDGRNAPASEAMLYETYLAHTDITVIRPAVAFSVKKEDRMIKSVMFASPDGLYEVEAGIVIDATGDADVAVFAGVLARYGSEDLSLTQNYSQMHVISGTAYDIPMADQDVINLTDRSEWQRCIRNNTMRSAPFDIYEMLTVRESRRIDGCSAVTLMDIYRGRRPKDVIYDCMSDYDTHSRCLSDIGRYGVLPSHAPIHFTAVPYGALLPKNADNLLVCAKAISADQIAAAHMRMSPDIMCIGHIAGSISARCALENIPLKAFDVSCIQEKMYELGAIVKKPSNEDYYENTPRMLAARLAAGDESAFAEALLCQWDALPEMLYEIRACGADTKPILTAMTLLYYGDLSFAPEAAKELDALNRAYGVKTRKDVYTGKIIMGGDISGRDPYFRIITLVMLLARSGLREYIPLIESVMNNTCLGEEFASNTPIVRPDMHVHGNFDRMLSLACAAICLPDPRFALPIMRLYRIQTENPNRAPVFSNVWLELKLAQAAYLSGHPDAEALLREFCENPYAVIRQGAREMLSKPKENPIQ